MAKVSTAANRRTMSKFDEAVAGPSSPTSGSGSGTGAGANALAYLRSYMWQSVTAGTTLTFTRPPASVVNDLLVVAINAPSGVTISTPTGWTKQSGPDNASGGKVFYLFTRLADGTATDLPAFTYSGSSTAGGIMFAFGGADISSPVNASLTPSTPVSQTGYTMPSTTTGIANALYVGIMVGGSAFTPAAASGGVEQVRTAGANAAFLCVTTDCPTISTSTGGYTGTNPVADFNATYGLVLTAGAGPTMKAGAAWWDIPRYSGSGALVNSGAGGSALDMTLVGTTFSGGKLRTTGVAASSYGTVASTTALDIQANEDAHVIAVMSWPTGEPATTVAIVSKYSGTGYAMAANVSSQGQQLYGTIGSAGAINAGNPSVGTDVKLLYTLRRNQATSLAYAQHCKGGTVTTGTGVSLAGSTSMANASSFDMAAQTNHSSFGCKADYYALLFTKTLLTDNQLKMVANYYGVP